MAATSATISAQMIAQLRLLDPSVSAEVGTPERKIIDTVAQGLADAQIDLEGLATALDIDSKYGSALDRFFAIFGFARQKAAYASGFVMIGRLAASNSDIRIPAGTRVRANIDLGDTSTAVDFATVYDVILPAGNTEVTAPIQALVSGTIGNVAAYDITEIVGSSSIGITEVYNELPTRGGTDLEDDDQFKVRFKNTVFRNLAGTRDQYLALAIATAYSTKANVIGPQSIYREYIQVPSTDDSGVKVIGGNLDPSGSDGAANGQVGNYTTALSTIPFAKEIWKNVPVFVSDGTSVGSHFYREGVDFTFNTGDSIETSRDKGDAFRLFRDYPDIEPDPNGHDVKPNVTFKNVYDGSNVLVDAIRPEDLVLLEYTYLSKASRNSLTHNVTNAVDVFVDGGNRTTASTIVSRPNNTSTFANDLSSVYHSDNYRRVGKAERRPDIGNVLVPLFWQPVLDIPEVLIVNDVTYYKGIHYWAVTDVSEIGGTFRSRSGIEFSTKEYGQRTGDIPSVDSFTGPRITEIDEDVSIEIPGYTYDRNIVDLQSALEAAKQITTDVLAHKAKFRYLKCDFAIMYAQGASETQVNAEVSSAVDSYLRSLFFGSVVQLSDIVQVAHGISGVDNIRWSSDLPDRPDNTRIYQTDADGKPLTNVSIEPYQRGRNEVSYTEAGDDEAILVPARKAVSHLFITGAPTSGTFTLRFTDNPTLTTEISVADTDAQIITKLNNYSSTLPSANQFTAAALELPKVEGEANVRGFGLNYAVNGPQDGSGQTVVYKTNLSGGPYIIKNDFFINDDEIVTLADEAYVPESGIEDSAPGIIARPRAQGTWIKS